MWVNKGDVLCLQLLLLPDFQSTMSSSILNFEDCDEETLKRLWHRGRANRCNTCLADDAKTVIMEKGHMEAHVYKEHVAPARVPFRCTLCQFRCQDRKTLDDHVLNYKPHVKAVKAGKGQVPEDCLKESSNPYYVSEEDYHLFSQDESARIWFEKGRGRRDLGTAYPFWTQPWWTPWGHRPTWSLCSLHSLSQRMCQGMSLL